MIAPDIVWSENKRMHWAARARHVKAWRDAACLWSRKPLRIAHKTNVPRPALVSFEISFPVNRTRDPHNYVGTVCKSIVDGLKDAGYWPDDNPDYVRVNEPTIIIRPGQSTVRVSITPLENK